MQWDRHVQCGRIICSGAYANNLKSMYASISGDIGDYSVFIWGIYTNIVSFYLHMD